MDSAETRLAKLHFRTSSESEWVELLNVPVNEISRFVNDPDVNAVKYLTYLAYCLTGSEGILSRHSHCEDQKPPSVVDPASLEQLVGSFYYYPESYDYIFADPDLLDARTSSSLLPLSEQSSSHCTIWSQALDIYGNKCPFTGSGEDYSGTCHLIPRRKGGRYLANVLRGRGMVIPDTEPEVDINDPRNIILIHHFLHFAFDKRDLAFLKLPNPVFNDASALGSSPSRNINGEVALTIHMLGDDPVLKTFHGKSCTLLDNNRSFEELYPFIYAIAAMKRWGVNLEILKAVNENLGHLDRECDEPKTEAILKAEAQVKILRIQRKELDERNGRRRRKKKDETGDLIGTVLNFRQANAAMAQKKAEKSRKTRNDEKVQNWLEKVW